MIIDILKKIKLIQQQSMNSEIHLVSDSLEYCSDLEDVKQIISDFWQSNIKQEQRLILSSIQEELKKLEQSIQKHNASVLSQKTFLESEIKKLLSTLTVSEITLISLNISKVKKEDLEIFTQKLSVLAEQNVNIKPNAKTVRILFESTDPKVTQFDFANQLSTELAEYSSDFSIQFTKKDVHKLINEKVFADLLN